jgi:hypothetical protein
MYSYGTPGQVPDLTLFDTVKDIDYVPLNGSGGVSGAVTFYNGDYAYEIASIFESDPFDGAASAVNHIGWINVTRNGRTLGRLECLPEPARYPYGSGIYDGKLAFGLVWDDQSGWVDWEK